MIINRFYPNYFVSFVLGMFVIFEVALYLRIQLYFKKLVIILNQYLVMIKSQDGILAVRSNSSLFLTF